MTLRIPFLILALAALTILPEILFWGADRGWYGTTLWRARSYQEFAFWDGLVRDWRPNYPAQPYTMFLTYAFVHSGPAHMLPNMAILVGFGPLIWRRVGNLGFAAIYFLSILGGAVAFSLLSNSPHPMVGASGALFGLVGSWLANDVASRREMGATLWPVALMIVGLVVLNLLSWWLNSGSLAWETHLGGGLAGWLADRLCKTRKTLF